MSDEIDIDQRPYIDEEFHATVFVDGGKPRLVPADPARWLGTLSKMAGPVKVTIRRPRKRRSTEANNYLFGVVYVDILIGLREIARRAGEDCPFLDDEDLHECMKYQYFGRDVVTFQGKKVEREARTRKLDSKAYAAFVDYVRRFAASEWGIYTREAGEEVSA